MEYRHVGRTGLQVSTVSLGTMGFAGTGWATPIGHIDVNGARRQIDIASAAGVNLIDTADVYSDGASEEILGEALGSKRDEMLIATKVRGGMGAGPNDGGLSRHHIVRAAEASLRRLRTDHIDLYQLHGWDGSTPLEETLAALDDLVRSGKVRYVGASNFSGWHLMKALWASGTNGFERFASQQIYYSLQSRDAENELVPITLDQGLGILVWSPLAGGLLTGKYRRGQDAPEGSRRFEGWTEPPIYDEDRLYSTIEVLIDIAHNRGASATQVGLAWTLAKPGVTSVIVGARTDEQLNESLGSADLRLTDAEIGRLDEASATSLPYPYWHQANTADGRSSAADLSLIARHIS